MSTIDFRQTFFYELMDRSLGYRPWIEIKPTHLANGFFSAICGGYVNNKVQHAAISPRSAPLKEADYASDKQQTAFEFWKRNRHEQEMLNRLFSFEKTVFTTVSTSSYSLSHANHVTSDNHDREAGRWLRDILSAGSESSALTLLRNLLLQEPRQRNDELSVLTLPLENQNAKRNFKEIPEWNPKSLKFIDGRFCDPRINVIRSAFDQLGENEKIYAGRNGKLDTLRRMTLLGCFSLYYHMINTGNNYSSDPIPMLLRVSKTGATLHKASIATYQRGIMHSIDQFIRAEIHPLVQRYTPPLGWNDESVKDFIDLQIDWLRQQADMDDLGKRNKAKRNRDACWRFYQSYRGDASEFNADEALVNAIADTLGLVLSSTPRYVAYRLGVHIGLLGDEQSTTAKSYLPVPDLLEVLVRATLPPGETWSLSKLANIWRKQFGILCGVLGNENDTLRDRNIAPVNRSELLANTEALIDILQQSGYARRYADGVVLVSVGA